MGRQATNSGRISLDVDAALKMKCTIAALKAGISLSTLVQRGMVLVLAEMRAQAKDEDK